MFMIPHTLAATQPGWLGFRVRPLNLANSPTVCPNRLLAFDALVDGPRSNVSAGGCSRSTSSLSCIRVCGNLCYRPCCGSTSLDRWGRGNPIAFRPTPEDDYSSCCFHTKGRVGHVACQQRQDTLPHWIPKSSWRLRRPFLEAAF